MAWRLRTMDRQSTQSADYHCITSCPHSCNARRTPLKTTAFTHPKGT